MPTKFSYQNDSDEDQRASPEQAAKDLHSQEQQSGYDRDFDALTDPEHLKKNGVQGDKGASNNDSDAVRNAEDEGGNWDSSYGGKKSKSGRTVTPMNVRAILKKRGPIGLIALLGLGGGIFGTVLFSPGILLVQMKEAIVSRTNTQFTTMDARSTRILGAKVKELKTGICGSKITVKCRYATMSDKQVKAFKDAGIDVKSTKTSILGQAKPDSLEFGGKEINASNFDSEFKSNPEFRSALNKGYNPKFAGFTDSIWTRVAGRLGINKTKALPDGDTAAKEKALREQTKNGSKLAIPKDDGITCDDNGKCTKDGKDGKPQELTPEEAEKARSVKKAVAAAAEEAAQEVGQEAAKTIGEVAKGTVGSVARFVSITGAVDDACGAYSSVRALGYAAKTVRAVQLAHYAMVFLNAADQIKAGTFSSADGAYLGGILTNVAYDAVSGAKRKAAMDSFGMQYALYGVGGKSDSYVSQFMAGGGLTGDLIAVTDYINAVLGKTPLETCRVFGNPAVQFGSIAVGIGLMFVPGVNVALTAGNIIKGVAAASVQVGLLILPGLLKDVVAGTVTDGIMGEDSGNAIAGGGGKIMSDLSASGGNGLLSVSDAIAYSETQNQALARYSEQDRLTADPLDVTNSNTFIGSIVSKLLPYSLNVKDVGGSFGNIGSFIGASFGSLIPKSSALSTEELRQSYTSCTDIDYRSFEIATDPMCNPIYGIPTEYLYKDPLQVADELINDKQIDEFTGAPIARSEYDSYVTNCSNRDRPIGDVGVDFSQDDGKACIINSQKVANYALFSNDQRVQNGMDGIGSDSLAQASGNEYQFYTPTDSSNPVANVVQHQIEYSTVGVKATPMKALSAQLTIADCLISDKTSPVTLLTNRFRYGIV
ncbi:hypothetical protein H7100_02450 [Candidatus Saccharibacteria bacterium]|nr:hypothetical protein [Candidatus Saccharibacteria bacterium]